MENDLQWVIVIKDWIEANWGVIAMVIAWLVERIGRLRAGNTATSATTVSTKTLGDNAILLKLVEESKKREIAYQKEIISLDNKFQSVANLQALMISDSNLSRITKEKAEKIYTSIVNDGKKTLRELNDDLFNSVEQAKEIKNNFLSGAKETISGFSEKVINDFKQEMKPKIDELKRFE